MLSAHAGTCATSKQAAVTVSDKYRVIFYTTLGLVSVQKLFLRGFLPLACKLGKFGDPIVKLCERGFKFMEHRVCPNE